MGKKWDGLGATPQAAYRWHKRWVDEAFRILKPGGHMIAFGGTRTLHRLTCAVEDAGFEVRDTIHWFYASGFPKGTRLSAQFDKQTVRDRDSGELVFRGNMDEIYMVTRYIAKCRDDAAWTNAMIDEAMGYVGMAGHWTTQKTQPQIPNWEQWGELKRLLDIPDDDEMDALVWRLNGRKGQPGEAWNEREVVGEYAKGPAHEEWRRNYDGNQREADGVSKRTAFDRFMKGNSSRPVTEPLTENAKAWEGWNTALKPAVEPAVLARKPLSEKTIAANVLRWGTGAINVDACRQPETDDSWPGPKSKDYWRDGKVSRPTTQFNYLADEFHEQPKAPKKVRATGQGSGTGAEIYGYRRAVRYGAHPNGLWPGNLFHCTKPSKREREAGLDDFEAKVRMPDLDLEKDWAGGHNAYLCGGAVPRKNNHPTVKPIKLMRWLCRMVCPPGGVVLDPFMGSGSTGCAAIMEGFDFIGCELYPLPPGHPGYDPKNNVDAFGISAARIEHWRGEAAEESWTRAYGSIEGLIVLAQEG